MKIKSLFLLILAFSLSAAPYCQAAPSMLGSSQDPKLVVNNRILAKANGKVISVLDIMKKMDLMFYKQFPQFAGSTPARYQFYLANWQSVLNDMIDKELVLADAEEMKITVSQGDVREEMETLFGPNIIMNLDKAGLTFNEAHQMVLDDITMRRMLYFRVHSKALSKVTPQVVRNFYEEYAKDNIRDNEWYYSVVTIRHKDPEMAAETATLVTRLINEEKVPLGELQKKVQEAVPPSPKTPVVTVSEELQTNEKELSDAYKKILQSLTPESYSDPISLKSRSDNSTVVRIFYLKKMVPGGAIPFAEIADRIKSKLLDEEIQKESVAYLAKIRKKYHVQDDQLQQIFSSDYQPFQLE